MQHLWTRREFLTKLGMAAGAIGMLNHFRSPSVFAREERMELFEVKQVADGIYAAIAVPQHKVNCNAAVIMNEDGVVVVDTHSKPSAARALVKSIAEITRKPVRQVINTHFHWDHWQGNEAYSALFPDIEIIASQATRENMTNPNAGNGGLGSIERQLKTLPEEIAQLQADLAKASNAEVRSRLESALQQTMAYLGELKGLKPALPTLTFERSLTLYKQGREIRLLFLGRAHTSGDLFVYLPKEKILVTGDCIIDWMPFLDDGYPEEWVKTLDEVEKLDFTTMIMGHGQVAGRDRLVFLRSFLADLIVAVKKAAADGATLDEIKRHVPDQLAPQYEQGMSKYPRGQYRERIGGNIEAVYTKVIRKG
ncbi:MAG: MBL fold metallo-hydrolase [candidate division NC10 bacterium]|nr:MBL fold metallo-hydrolase [candidate division NC10 bacterium]